MNNTNIDFPLYLSGIKIIEKETPELSLTYEGDETLVETLYLIGKNNGLKNDIAKAKIFNLDKEGGRTVFSTGFIPRGCHVLPATSIVKR